MRRRKKLSKEVVDVGACAEDVSDVEFCSDDEGRNVSLSLLEDFD